ncbi:MAG: caspase family protein [Saprospiraceae bacterium]|nr:caspase family protein [Candidatus Vicinibacter affinis]
MKYILFIIFIIFYTSIGVAQSDRGVKPKENPIPVTGKSYAIIIGISKYKNIAQLNYSDRDAIAFRTYLMNVHHQRVDSQNISIFLNEEATKLKIGDAINNVLVNAVSGDKVYFFFAGHGDIEDRSQSENGLLLLYDSPKENYFEMIHEILQINMLSDYFEKLTTKGVDITYIIDACHSGKLAGGMDGSKHTSYALKNTLSRNSTVLLSCDANQLSLEGLSWGEGRGLFSYYLEEGLLGLAESNQDEVISLYELKRYLEEKVFLESEYKQSPVIIGKWDKKLTLVNPKFKDSLDHLRIKEYPNFKIVNIKGDEEIYLNDLDERGKMIYKNFNNHLLSGNLIEPVGENAMRDYWEFNNLYPDHQFRFLIRRNLAAQLTQTFDSLIAPLWKGFSPNTKPAKILSAARQLDSCLLLLEETHFMYTSILSRRFYVSALMESMGIDMNNYTPIDKARMQNALQHLDKSRVLEPNAVYVYFTIGIIYQSMALPDSALIYFRKYLSLVPNSYAAFNVIGIALADLGEETGNVALMKESVSLFEKAILLNPTFKSPHVNLIYVHGLLQRYDQCKFYFDKMMLIDSNFSSTYNNMAQVYLEMGKPDLAIKHWETSALKFPKRAYVPYLGIAKLSIQSRDYVTAEKYLELIIKENPKCAEAYFLKGKMLFKKGEYLTALFNYQKGLSINGSHPKYYEEMGWCYRFLNQRTDAKLYFDTCVLLHQASRYPNFKVLADVFQYGLNEYKRADEYYVKALGSDSLNIELMGKHISNLFMLQQNKLANNWIQKLSKLSMQSNWLPYAMICKYLSELKFSLIEIDLEKLCMDPDFDHRVLVIKNWESVNSKLSISDSIKKCLKLIQ